MRRTYRAGPGEEPAAAAGRRAGWGALEAAWKGARRRPSCHSPWHLAAPKGPRVAQVIEGVARLLLEEGWRRC